MRKQAEPDIAKRLTSHKIFTEHGILEKPSLAAYQRTSYADPQCPTKLAIGAN